MSIDHIIISSDNNPTYKDFYELIAQRWYDLGFKTYYINISDKDEIVENEFGTVHTMKALDFVSTAFQSQVVRIFASNILSGNLLISDIDMFPISKDYYNQYNSELTDDNIIVYTGIAKQFNNEGVITYHGPPNLSTPYYPMCYMLGNVNAFQDRLDIRGMTFEEYCRMLVDNYTESWNTDEHFCWDRFKKYPDKILLKTRITNTRIDRGTWVYDVDLLKNGYYVDSHLLRPYQEHKQEIQRFIDDVERLC